MLFGVFLMSFVVYLKEKRLYRRNKLRIENYLKNIPEELKKSERKRVIADCLYARQHTAFSTLEYFMHDFPHKTHEQWLEYLSNHAAFTIFKRMNKNNPYHTADKYLVYCDFKQFFGRDACKGTEIFDKDTFFSFVKEKKTVLLKPLCGSLGDDVVKFRESDLQKKMVFEELLKKYPEGFIAEELIKQSEEMAKFNPTSVNTLRITTVRMDDKVYSEAFLRVGKMFSLVDNVAKGGMVCSLNQQTGEITQVTDEAGNVYLVHPDTGYKLVGNFVPRLGEAIEMAEKMANHIPNYRYMGWDLALTDNGWVLVELNAKANTYCIQLTMGRGIRKDFERFFEKIGESSDFPEETDDTFMKDLKKENRYL